MISTQSQRYPVVPGILFLLLLLALLILPEVARRLAVRQLQASLLTPVTIRDVDLNLITGKARISGLVIGSKDGKRSILKLPRLDLHFSRLALFQKEIIIHRAIASGAEVELERTGLIQWKGTEILRPVEKEWGVIGDFKVKIQNFEIQSGDITVVDRRTTPDMIITVQHVRLTARPVYQTARPTRISLDLQGTMAGSSSIKLQGWFTPFAQPLQVHLEGNIQDYELSHLNPYAKKYLGQEFRRGRLSSEFKLHYNGGTIDAFNDLRIRHAQVGAAFGDQFKRRVGISLKLALNLLEDAGGEIRLPISVKGTVDSPEFEADGVMWKGLRNAVLKTLVAPLRLLGNILTLGGKITEVRIDPVNFKPGSLTLNRKTQVQIERLSKFLKSRPLINLQLQGRTSRQETNVLARRKPKGQMVTNKDLRALAERRVRLIEKTLVRQGVPPKRLFVVATDRKAIRNRGAGRVEFRLLD